MIPRRSRIPMLMLAAVAVLSPCLSPPAGADTTGSHEPPSARLQLVVSILPQVYFVQRIGGTRVEVEALVGPGQSHETYEPTPKQVAALASASAFFTIGVPFERGLIDNASRLFQKLTIVDTRAGIPLRPMTELHLHGGASTGQGAPDPHIWLDPLLVKQQAHAIAAALSRIDPADSALFAENLRLFQAELDTLHYTISAILEPHRGLPLWVFHPAFGYFTDRYGLVQQAIEIDGKEPGARKLTRLTDLAREQRITAIFVQPQFAGKSAAAIAAELGARLVPLDPITRDFPADMLELARTVAAGLPADSAR
jgi:zinc transport system substrate-binding protein